MPNEDKKTFAEKRQERQKGRVDKLTEKRKAEAKQAGVDLDKTIDIGPLGSERKERIDKIMQEGVKDELKTGLKRIQDLRTPPEVDTPKKPSIELDIKDVRKQRRAKIADIMNSIAQGMLGEEVTPTIHRDRLKGERLSQLNQYKDASTSAKNKLKEWESAYIDEQLDYLNSKINDPNTSDLKKNQLEKSRVQLEIEKSKLGISKEKLKQLKEGDKDGEDEETARYVKKIGGDETLTRNIPMEEARELEREAQIKEATKMIDIELSQAKMDLAEMGKEGTKKREIINRPKRQNLEAKILSLEEQRQQIIDALGGESESPQINQEVNTVSEEDDLWNL